VVGSKSRKLEVIKLKEWPKFTPEGVLALKRLRHLRKFEAGVPLDENTLNSLVPKWTNLQGNTS
jgi:hypothetical protein